MHLGEDLIREDLGELKDVDLGASLLGGGSDGLGESLQGNTIGVRSAIPASILQQNRG